MPFRESARLLLVLLTLVLATATLGGTASAAPTRLAPAAASLAPYPPLVSTSSATPQRLSIGDCTAFTGSGFAPASAVTLTDNGASFGSVVSDAGGAFRLQRCFSGTSVCGAHALAADGLRTDSSAVSDSALVTMICAVQQEPGGTHALRTRPGTSGFGLLLYLLVIGSVGLLLTLLLRALLARRRDRPEPS